jgi:hypothetical protein
LWPSEALEARFPHPEIQEGSSIYKSTLSFKNNKRKNILLLSGKK